MIELLACDDDDLGFLQMIERTVNGANAALQTREVYLVHIDNWFDYKWLGFWSRVDKQEEWELSVPPFNPNRVRSEKRFLWDAIREGFTSAAHEKPLHRRQPGLYRAYRAPLDRWSKSAAFIWYSGNTITNTRGSLMIYLSGANGYAWYASFRKKELWEVEGERRIARRELETFEKRGREIKAART